MNCDYCGVEYLAGTDEIIKTRSTANKMLIMEAATVTLCGLLFFVFANLEYTYSVILGGLAFIVPNIIFVMFSLGTSKASSSGKTLALFYIGEAIKIVSTITIFVVSIMMVESINIALMFISYGVIVLMNLTGLAILMSNNK